MKYPRFSAKCSFLSVLALTSVAAPALAAGVQPLLSRPQIGLFGFDEAGMNRSTKPGDDFYNYANGAWDQKTVIPDDRASYGMFTQLADLSTQRMKTILDELVQNPGNKIGDFYASYMDQKTVNLKGIKPLQPTIDAIKAIQNRHDFARQLGALMPLGVSGPFTFLVEQDDRNPEQYIVSFHQSGLGMPDRDYYLNKDAQLENTRKAYVAYLTKLFQLTGQAYAEQRAANIMAFETNLATVQWRKADRRDRDLTYNKWQRSDFDSKAPHFDWNAFFSAADINSQQEFLVSEPTAFTAMARSISKTSIQTLKDYLYIRALSAGAPFLSQPFSDAHFAFYGTALSGQPQDRPRWKKGTDLIDSALGEEIGKIYVARYFPPEAKAAADQLVKNITAAMDRRIDNLSWMSPESKKRAHLKLASFTPKIGYPDKWRDYTGLTVVRDDLFGNVQRSNIFDYQYNLSKLGKPLDRGEWFMTPMTVNAYANPPMNEIVFPAAILQPPFFDPNADPAINYGGIGSVIGHELSHHFDDQGAKYNEKGALAQWWLPSDIKNFNALTDKLAKQYDNYEPLPGFHVQGRLTLGENIADLAGLTLSYDAYHASLGDQIAPILDGTTGDQRFYLGWGQVWRRKQREAAERQQLLTDPHSPSRYRVATVRNLDPWYQSFDVKEGDQLYLAPADRVRIW
ncbi:MAG: M13 family metallopeptidase [Zymomonas mobilis subsp. pomaceae]|uniref:Endothelin-converting enzyme 1 n=1 Tax=Zymomonas mobilis subsp. pomaceae (strain ATCC 29192 / DSM 22645 / JCM 10191 / CCUG 17912 / NBRC 13757 / NCIMB 11200 / NRRL B-4491 / Barker I) TaxID=579138 RepID=F8EVU2_ZYMMT|nr:M13 family metallopeptidase [Zymomonas mobilis]AEI37419.1 Endothelin-converting enzyme 1 [Zymomonas mobilis subsp. pomaceae ATCC 29192]MDX5948786.1 M13 family metallopeptidase [Zymomonas mobilis subsp. pomaceae]GEB88594.1 peptidase M13 [Zymomonas mobilis subsp. pomaceae]